MSQLSMASVTSLSSRWSIRNSINHFSFKLFKVFASRHQDDSRNMCFSPLEVFNSLAMLLIGAEGITATQLEEMLCLHNFNYQEKHDELIELREWIVKSNHDIMVYGTFIYIDKSLEIKSEYVEKLKNMFEIKPKRINFANLDEAIQTINNDSFEITDGVVEGVIAKKDLQDDPHLRLVISNAVFFRGYWQFRFGDIHKAEFYYWAGQKSALIDMMSHVGQHRYYYDPELQAQTVSIAYASSDIRMMIILPQRIISEAVYLIHLLSGDKLASLFDKLQSSPKSLTELTIPRFALDAHKVSLQKSVKQMGAKSIYDRETAQLTNICANDRIHLTKLVHKAFILVDERGSHTSSSQSQEARYMLNESGADFENIPVVFKANHPFVFIILDKITGVVCFMGVFADPTEMLEVVNQKDLSREEITELLAECDNLDHGIARSFSSSSTG